MEWGSGPVGCYHRALGAGLCQGCQTGTDALASVSQKQACSGPRYHACLCSLMRCIWEHVGNGVNSYLCVNEILRKWYVQSWL